MNNKIITLCIAFFGFFVLESAIINIPLDQPSIQQGIDVSVNGDTVLVHPGTYLENINYNGKNITVASLFLTTQNTIYVSQTIIDGNQNGSVVTLESGENGNAVLSGFSITNGSGTYGDPDGNGYFNYNGGGIYSIDSNPIFDNLKIFNNSVESGGAGIYFYNSDVNVSNSDISNNSAEGNGGGIDCIASSNLNLSNSIISNNQGGSLGGGLLLHSESHSSFSNVVFKGNSSSGKGGGICSYSSNIDLEDTKITENNSNSGGGIFTYNCEINLSGTSISFNTAESDGGGIQGNNIIFDEENRSSIYSNTAQFGCDLCSYPDNSIEVIVDTFTVLQPTNLHAFPLNNYTFDILHSVYDQIEADLYVSPDGDNANSGLSFDDPLRTINYALSIICASEENPRIIYLDSGLYSPDTNGENFPVLCTSWISLIGFDEEATIIDAGNTESVVYCAGVDGVSIENLTLTNGIGHWDGGGIFCANSELDLSNVTISDCGAGTAGGISHSNSISSFNNITVINNTAKHYGGIYCSGSELTIENSEILENFADEIAGGIYCNSDEVIISETAIIGNHAGTGGGLICSNSSPLLQNVLISENYAYYEGGGMDCWNSAPVLENVTISHNYSEYRGGGIDCTGDICPIFDENNRSSIYLNTSTTGHDIYSQPMMNVIVDTFTVMNPTGFYASPITNFTFDILNGMIEQVSADLYVSPEGDDVNDGLSWDSPLKTVACALSKIIVDSLNEHTIFLSSGIFSPQTTGEVFPIHFIDYITICGMGMDSTFIKTTNDNEVSDAFYFEGVRTATLRDLNITESYGIDCRDNSSPELLNLSISGSLDRGIFCTYDSDAIIRNCVIFDNSTGIGCHYDSDPIIINTTIADNEQQYGNGGISCYDNCHPIIVNSILWDNYPYSIEFRTYGDPCSATISHCDIEDGEDGIVTGNGSVNWLDGNLDSNPIFVAQQDYHLQNNSPCIDAGTEYFEWQNIVWLDLSSDDYNGIAPDLGAYEYSDTSANDDLPIEAVKLYSSFPNPFKSFTTISFQLTTEHPENTEINIYNIKGQRIREIGVRNEELGLNKIIWDGTNDLGKPVGSGIYFYNLKVDGKSIDTKKCLLVR